MRKYKICICFILVSIIACSLSTAFFATFDDASDVETVIDAVAEKEATAKAEAEAAAAEASKVNDIVDMDAESDNVSTEEVVQAEMSAQEGNAAPAFSGPMLALIVAILLIICGLAIISASNRKIKAGRKIKTVK